MTDTKVLFATDFTERNRSALAYAAAQAKDMNAELVIAHVRDVRDLSASGEGALVTTPPPPEEVERKLKDVVPNDFPGPVRHRVLTGLPAEALVRLAADEDVDLIVMGTHGRRGLARVLMGSVAEGVVRGAHCPVLVVRHRSEE